MTGRKKRITALAAAMGILVTVQGIAAYQSAFDTAEKLYVIFGIISMSHFRSADRKSKLFFPVA